MENAENHLARNPRRRTKGINKQNLKKLNPIRAPGYDLIIGVLIKRHFEKIIYNVHT